MNLQVHTDICLFSLVSFPLSPCIGENVWELPECGMMAICFSLLTFCFKLRNQNLNCLIAFASSCNVIGLMVGKWHAWYLLGDAD